MTTRLIALNGGPDFIVGPSPLVVGRDPTCDVGLTSRRVSRRHCCLVGHEGELLVRDLGSLNGIRVNGRRVVTGRLRPGDELAIAWYQFRVEPGAPDAPPLPGSSRCATVVTLASASTCSSCSVSPIDAPPRKESSGSGRQGTTDEAPGAGNPEPVADGEAAP